MAHVMVFNNFFSEGHHLALVPRTDGTHTYRCAGPGRFQANPYSKTKHIGLGDALRRLVACVVLAWRTRRYDILIVDSAVTGLLMATLLFVRKSPQIVIASFNVPRRRKGVFRALCRLAFRRIRMFIVHSTYDVGLASRLYGIPRERLLFLPFVREQPARGTVDQYLRPAGDDYLISFGGNGRDYGTLFAALDGTDVHAVVVAREYNLAGLKVPRNVSVLCNIPLADCDKLVGNACFSVFTLDGSEPSCGQISMVTSMMLGKPVLCTECEATRDYVTHGVNGLLVRKGDREDVRRAILMLWRDPALVARLGRAAKNWADQNANPTTIQRRIDEAVTNIVSGRLSGVEAKPT